MYMQDWQLPSLCRFSFTVEKWIVSFVSLTSDTSANPKVSELSLLSRPLPFLYFYQTLMMYNKINTGSLLVFGHIIIIIISFHHTV